MLLAAIFSFQACSNDKPKEEKAIDKKEEGKEEPTDSYKETPSSIAKSWCALNKNVTKAATDEAKATAKQTLKNYETWIENTYKDDEAMRKSIEAEVEKCEAASEGR